jgi:hypothetical protein
VILRALPRAALASDDFGLDRRVPHNGSQKTGRPNTVSIELSGHVGAEEGLRGSL